jgi:hypothetical protein
MWKWAQLRHERRILLWCEVQFALSNVLGVVLGTGRKPMRRRELITRVGGVAASWPLGARAPEATMPAIGFLRSTSQNDSERLLKAFRG